MLLKGQYHEKIRSFLCQWGAVVGSNYEPPSFFKHLKLLNIIEILSYDLLQPPHGQKERIFPRYCPFKYCFAGAVQGSNAGTHGSIRNYYLKR